MLTILTIYMGTMPKRNIVTKYIVTKYMQDTHCLASVLSPSKYWKVLSKFLALHNNYNAFGGGGVGTPFSPLVIMSHFSAF